jgi:hypothetical protein
MSRYDDIEDAVEEIRKASRGTISDTDARTQIARAHPTWYAEYVEEWHRRVPSEREQLEKIQKSALARRRSGATDTPGDQLIAIAKGYIDAGVNEGEAVTKACGQHRDLYRQHVGPRWGRGW